MSLQPYSVIHLRTNQSRVTAGFCRKKTTPPSDPGRQDKSVSIETNNAWATSPQDHQSQIEIGWSRSVSLWECRAWGGAGDRGLVGGHGDSAKLGGHVGPRAVKGSLGESRGI